MEAYVAQYFAIINLWHWKSKNFTGNFWNISKSNGVPRSERLKITGRTSGVFSNKRKLKRLRRSLRRACGSSASGSTASPQGVEKINWKRFQRKPRTTT